MLCQGPGHGPEAALVRAGKTQLACCGWRVGLTSEGGTANGTTHSPTGSPDTRAFTPSAGTHLSKIPNGTQIPTMGERLRLSLSFLERLWSWLERDLRAEVEGASGGMVGRRTMSPYRPHQPENMTRNLCISLRQH